MLYAMRILSPSLTYGLWCDPTTPWKYSITITVALALLIKWTSLVQSQIVQNSCATMQPSKTWTWNFSSNVRIKCEDDSSPAGKINDATCSLMCATAVGFEVRSLRFTVYGLRFSWVENEASQVAVSSQHQVLKTMQGVLRGAPGCTGSALFRSMSTSMTISSNWAAGS